MIFDASAIYALIRLALPRVLSGGKTLDLAAYELGNAILKEVTVLKTLTASEGFNLIRLVIRVLEIMSAVSISGSEEDVFRLAFEHNLTFYDASYLHLAKEAGEALVTEDKDLREVATGLVEVLSVADLLKLRQRDA